MGTVVVFLLMAATLFATGETGSDFYFHVEDNVLPENGREIVLICEIQKKFDGTVWIQHSENENKTDDVTLTNIGYCDTNGCIEKTNFGYNLKVEFNDIVLVIRKLQRTSHQRWWHCGNTTVWDSLQLTVYTNPTNVTFTSVPSNAADLSLTGVTLTCQTDCTFPSRHIVWYYTEIGGSRNVYTSNIQSTRLSSECPDLESPYSSTLELEALTTFEGNVEKTGWFECGVTAFKQAYTLFTEKSQAVTFAVQVSYANLTSADTGTNTDNDNVLVMVGVLERFHCETSVSRPPATIIWYKGGIEMQRSDGPNYNFIPEISDHGQSVYCEAFNIQPSTEAVRSNVLILKSLDVPPIPANFMVDATSILSDSVSFYWTAASDEGLIERYYLSHKATEEVNWRTTITLPGNSSRYTLSGLRPSTVYKVQLYSSNVVGTSNVTRTIAVKTGPQTDIEEAKDGANTGLLAAAVAGWAMFVIAVVVVAVLCIRKHRNTLPVNYGGFGKLPVRQNSGKQGDKESANPRQNSKVDIYYSAPLENGSSTPEDEVAGRVRLQQERSGGAYYITPEHHAPVQDGKQGLDRNTSGNYFEDLKPQTASPDAVYSEVSPSEYVNMDQDSKEIPTPGYYNIART